MKEHVEDLKRLESMLSSIETQLKLCSKGNTKEIDTLKSEYKMFMHKKCKIKDDYDNKQLKYLSIVKHGPHSSVYPAAASTSLSKFSRLADDYGHRRFIRKAQRLHRDFL